MATDREPGYYWVKWRTGLDWEIEEWGIRFHGQDGAPVMGWFAEIMPPPEIIGPRIPEPEEV